MSAFSMNDSQMTIIDDMRSCLGQNVTTVERLKYRMANQPYDDNDDGDLSLWLTDSVMRFETESDGERLRLSREPWIDPFEGPQPDENVKYLVKHGQWVQVDVSQEPPYAHVVGTSLEEVLPIADSFGQLIGCSLTLGGVVLNVFVEIDELRVTWGASNVPLWQVVR